MAKRPDACLIDRVSIRFVLPLLPALSLKPAAPLVAAASAV